MYQLILSVWNVFLYLKNNYPSLILKDSVPILWFGDLDAYYKSSKKIVTVSINPSDMEFKDIKVSSPSVSYRFNGLNGISLSSPLTDIKKYEDAMNDYFKYNPYTNWFASFENMLNGLNASYYHNTNFANRSLHIDIYAPVATYDKWHCLNPNERTTLITTFNSTFMQLMNLLSPDVVLLSVNKKVRQDVFLKGISQLIYKQIVGLKGRAYVEVYKLSQFINNMNLILISTYNYRGIPLGGVCKTSINSCFKNQILPII